MWIAIIHHILQALWCGHCKRFDVATALRGIGKQKHSHEKALIRFSLAEFGGP